MAKMLKVGFHKKVKSFAYKLLVKRLVKIPKFNKKNNYRENIFCVPYFQQRQ